MMNPTNEIDQILFYWYGQKKNEVNEVREGNEWRGGLWFHGIDDTTISHTLSGTSQRQSKKNAQKTTDDFIRHTFGPIIDRIMTENGEISEESYQSEWMITSRGKMALVLLLDQLARNSYRGTSRMFLYDSFSSKISLSLLQEKISLPWNYKLFLFISLTHSEEESLVNQAAIGLSSLVTEFQSNETSLSLQLGKKITRVLHATEDHLTILQRFGRYPHRNYLLNRINTPEEEKYLQGPLPTWARSVGYYHAPTIPAIPQSLSEVNVPSISSDEVTTRKSKPSILVLHSSKQNPISFIKATRRVLGEDSEESFGTYNRLTVVPATHSYTPNGITKEILEGIENPSAKYNRCWWNATDDPETMIYEGLEDSITFIDQCCKKYGPFDGLFGFSQGGSLAGIISYLQEIKSPLVKHCKFQFVVIISGFACRDVRPEFNMSTRPPIPINIPSFHVWGLSDTLVVNSRSECLANWFVNPVVKTHVGAHFFGAINLWPVSQINDWIRSLPFEVYTQTKVTEIDQYSATLTFEEKFDLTRERNQVGSNLSSYTPTGYQPDQKKSRLQVMTPAGISNPDILRNPIWEDIFRTVPIHQSHHFTREMIENFIAEIFRSNLNPNSVESFQYLVGDLFCFAFCVYPFPGYAPHNERTRSKILRLATQGEVFYWIFFEILLYILKFSPKGFNRDHTNELVRYYLEQLLAIGNWNDIFRLDLLLCTGSSVKVIANDKPSEDVTEDSEQVLVPRKAEMILPDSHLILHEIILNLIVSQLCLDIQRLQNLQKEPNSQLSTKYDDLVSKKLQYSLDSNDHIIHSEEKLSGSSEAVSDCIKYCPRLRSYTEKSTGFASILAWRLYKRLNQSGSIINSGDDLETTENLTTESYTVHIPPICRTYYRQILRLLSDHHAALELLSKDNLSLIRAKEAQSWRIKAYGTCSEEEYQQMVISTPLTNPTLHPEPEPVDVATPEEMSQLYAFFQSQYDEHNLVPSLSIDQKHQEMMRVFDKGTLCSDGRLDLCKQVVGPNGITSLMNSLYLDSTSKNQVQHLLLGNNICGNGLGEAVGKFIASGKSKLTTWYIAGNRLTAEGIKPVCDALESDTLVTQLWLKRNPLHALGASHIGRMLRMNSTLIVLDLVNTGLFDEGGYQILSALGWKSSSSSEGSNSINQTLQHLYLDGNGFTSQFAHSVGEYLQTTNISNHSLITLSLGCNRFGDIGTISICNGFSKNQNIQRVCLASVGMGINGAKSIAKMLKVNQTLRHLDIGLLKNTAAIGEFPNRIGTEGAIAIAEILKYSNNTLYSLLLLNNHIHQAGMSALRSALLDSYSDEIEPTSTLTHPTQTDTASHQADTSIKQTINTTLVKLELEQMGVPFNELTKEEIRLALRRNYLLLSSEKEIEVNEAINPSHLGPIQSVYRVNGTYTK